MIFYRVKHHNQSIIFGIVILDDETGETYVWFLKNFLETMEGKYLVFVKIYRDLAMKNEIRRVLLDAHRHIFNLHLIRNVSNNIKM